jgi:site-specific recombinase XerD
MEALTALTNKLKAKRYSRSTIQVYRYCFQKFQDAFNGVNLNGLEKDEIQDYLLNYIVPYYGKSTQNQHINAIKFYYEKILSKPRSYYELDRPLQDKRIPAVLEKVEVEFILQSIHNLKHKAVLAVIYSSGLRVGELLALKLTDVDSKRMVFNIRSAKGNKAKTILTPFR